MGGDLKHPGGQNEETSGAAKRHNWISGHHTRGKGQKIVQNPREGNAQRGVASAHQIGKYLHTEKEAHPDVSSPPETTAGVVGGDERVTGEVWRGTSDTGEMGKSDPWGGWK